LELAYKITGTNLHYTNTSYSNDVKSHSQSLVNHAKLTNIPTGRWVPNSLSSCSSCCCYQFSKYP